MHKPVRLVGKITRVEWTNPHSYFYVDVTDAKGAIATGDVRAQAQELSAAVVGKKAT